MVSKATVHPAAANDDDVVVTRPAASLAQGNSAESAEMKAKIVSFFSSFSPSPFSSLFSLPSRSLSAGRVKTCARMASKCAPPAVPLAMVAGCVLLVVFFCLVFYRIVY